MAIERDVGAAGAHGRPRQCSGSRARWPTRTEPIALGCAASSRGRRARSRRAPPALRALFRQRVQLRAHDHPRRARGRGRDPARVHEAPRRSTGTRSGRSRSRRGCCESRATARSTTSAGTGRSATRRSPPSPASEDVAAERRHAIEDALRSLQGQRRVVVLRHVVGLSPREIASQMGKSEGAGTSTIAPGGRCAPSSCGAGPRRSHSNRSPFRSSPSQAGEELVRTVARRP